MNRPAAQLVTSGPLPYLISCPSTDAEEQDWPILCFLHGCDEGQSTPIEQGLTRHGPLRPSSSPVATNEFVVVAPQMPVSGDFWHRYADQVQDIVQQVELELGGDSRRRFLTGFSFGGNGVFDLAIKPGNYWQALWPVDPTRVPPDSVAGALGQPLWLSSGQISRFSEDRLLRRLQLEALRPEVADKVVPGRRVYFDQGQDHVGTATLAYADDRIYRWLLAI